MKPNSVTIAGLVVGASLVCTAASCSEDSSTSNAPTTFSCAATGSKPCPNDNAVTEQAYNLCKRCESELAALARCRGQSGPKCDANGRSEESVSDPSRCNAESDAVVKCSNAPDGGADAGG